MVQLYSLWDNPPIKYSDYLKKKGSEKNVKTEFQRGKGGNPNKGVHRQI